MAMIPGAVSIDDDGIETGAATTSMAGSIYLELIASLADTVPPFEVPTGPGGVPIKRGFASLANSLGTGIVTYIQAHAQAKITTSDVGLQRHPATDVVDTPCNAPAADKFIAIV